MPARWEKEDTKSLPSDGRARHSPSPGTTGMQGLRDSNANSIARKCRARWGNGQGERERASERERKTHTHTLVTYLQVKCSPSTQQSSTTALSVGNFLLPGLNSDTILSKLLLQLAPQILQMEVAGWLRNVVTGDASSGLFHNACLTSDVSLQPDGCLQHWVPKTTNWS